MRTQPFDAFILTAMYLTVTLYCHFAKGSRTSTRGRTALLLLYFQVSVNCASASTDSLVISRNSAAKRRHWMSASLVTDYTPCNTSYTISLPISLVPSTMKTRSAVRTAA